jgi:hypothetical protein
VTGNYPAELETYPMQDRPLLDRLTPADVATLLAGNETQRKAGKLLARYGLDLTRDTARINPR